MPEVTNFTDPLNGFEPIEYVVGEVRKFLRRDCSLRREDGYSGGFQGKIKIELDCFAVRTVHIEQEIPIHLPPEVKTAINALPPDKVDKFHIDHAIEIPRNENLEEVRAQIQELAEDAVDQSPVEPEPKVVMPRLKRQYRKRAAFAGAVAE